MSTVIAARLGIAVALAFAAGGAAASEADLALGRYLASQCLTCHVEQDGSRIPKLSGMRERAFTEAIDSFRAKRRPSQIMSPIAERLTDEDVAALARYFATARPTR